jgi:restriction system protein
LSWSNLASSDATGPSPLTEVTGDGGVDVTAHTDELAFLPPNIKIQCKRQTTPIGEPQVGQLLGI